jgi:glycosyltransferase involved in cell wall biosynthesis
VSALKTIWIFHHYADPPDGHWTGTYDLYKPLADKGHRLTVFSSSFSHYTRREERLGAGEWHRTRWFGGIEFVFIRSSPYEHNDWRRLLGMMTFAARAFRAGFGRGRPDIVIGSTPHPFCAIAAALTAQRTGARFFLELHDLWVDYMLDTGVVAPSSLATWALRQMDRWCYRRAERILALWPQMDRHLRAQGVPADKMIWTPMGVRIEDAGPDLRRRRNGVLRVVCTARFGPASNIGEIVDAARILRQRGEPIEFVLVGGGPEEARLRAQAHDLPNVTFTGMVPKAEVRRHLLDADVTVAGLPDVATYNLHGTIPSKVLDYLTTGRPVVFVSALEDDIVQRAQAGRSVRPGSPANLADAISELAALPPEQFDQLGHNGLAYVRTHHDLDRLAARIEGLF